MWQYLPGISLTKLTRVNQCVAVTFPIGEEKKMIQAFETAVSLITKARKAFIKQDWEEVSQNTLSFYDYSDERLQQEIEPPTYIKNYTRMENHNA